MKRFALFFFLFSTFTKVHSDLLNWSSPPTTLFPPLSNVNLLQYFSLAVDPSGDGVAVWTDTVTLTLNSVAKAASYHKATNSWSTPVTISAPSTRATLTHVSVDPSGDAIAIWIAIIGLQFVVEARTYSKELQQWRDDITQLSDSSLDAVSNCQIGIDAFGDGIALWMELIEPTANQAVQVAYYRKATQTWSPLPGSSSFPLYITRSSSYIAQSPSLAVNPTGDGIAIWSNVNAGNFSIEAATYSKATHSWSSSPIIHPSVLRVINGPASTSNDPLPQVAIDSMGNGVAVWKNWTTNTIEEDRYTRSSNTWTTLSPLAPLTLSTVGGAPQNPQIALNEEGNGAAIWEQTIGGVSKIMSSYYTVSNHSWSSPSALSGSGNSITPQIAIDPIGNLVGVWQETLSGVPAIHTSQSIAGTATWSAPQILSSTLANQVGFSPLVKMGDIGIALALWGEDDNGAATTTVQSSSASLSPFPPSSLSGQQKFNRFPTQSEFFNQLRWIGSPSSLLDHYQIFRNGEWIGSVPASETTFRDHHRRPGVPDTYDVTVINRIGNASTPITITIP